MVFEFGRACVLEQGIAAVGRVAEVPVFRDVGIDGTGLQIVPRGGAGGGAAEVGMEPIGGELVQFEEPSAQLAALVLAG
jgi:hypothetical protein